MSVAGAARTGPSPQVLRSIAAAARDTGVSFAYLLRQAKSESGFDPSAKAATSSASGLYQFTRQTWLATLDAHGAGHGLGWAAEAIDRLPGGSYKVDDPEALQAILDLRNDPSASAAMAAELALDNGDHLSRQLGRPASETDLALAHFLGADGAAKFLTALAASPEASAAPLFPEAAVANRPVFYDPDGAPRSLAEVQARFASAAAAQAAPPAANIGRIVRQEIRSERGSAGWTGPIATIEPMPRHLSLTFAEAAYRRLAAMGNAS